MMAGNRIERGEAVAPAPAPNVALQAIANYPASRIDATAYPVRVIAARFRLSPAVARKVVELGGIGGDA